MSLGLIVYLRWAFTTRPGAQRARLTRRCVSVPCFPPSTILYSCHLVVWFFKYSSLWLYCHQIQIWRQVVLPRNFITSIISSSPFSVIRWSSCSCKVLTSFYYKSNFSVKKKHGPHKIICKKGSLAIMQDFLFSFYLFDKVIFKGANYTVVCKPDKH